MDVSKDQSITDESASSNYANVTKDCDEDEDDKEKEEAVTNCDDKNTTAEVETDPTSGKKNVCSRHPIKFMALFYKQ